MNPSDTRMGPMVLTAITSGCCGVDAGLIGDIQSEYLQFTFVVFGEAAQFESRGWVAASCVDLPSIGEILAGKLEPKSSIGAGD